MLKELDELVDQHGVPRRAEIVAATEIVVHEQPTRDDTQTVGVDEPCVVTLSTSGNIGRAPTNGARRATVGRHDLIAAARHDHHGR